MKRLKEEEWLSAFEEVWALGEGMEQWALDHRMKVTKVVSVDDLLYYGAGKRCRILVRDKSDLGEGYVADFNAVKIVEKNFKLEFLNPCDTELIKVFQERNTEYRKKCMALTKQRRGEAGEFVGGVVPYGYYTYRKKLYVDEYESFIVKFIFYRRTQGVSYNNIAKEMELRGWFNRQEKPFSSGSVKNIVDKVRFYQGWITYNGVEYRGKHKAILKDNDKLLTDKWIDRTFDIETEKRIAEQKIKISSDRVLPRVVKPFIIADGEDVRRLKKRC